MVTGGVIDVTSCILCWVGTWPPIYEVSLHRDLILLLNVIKAQISSDNCYSVFLFLIFYCIFFVISVKVSCATWFG